MPISMNNDQYEALLDFAYGRRSATDEAEALRDLQRRIDTTNSVRRYFLYIRWMETGGSPPSRIEIGRGWPPSQQYKLFMDRPITPEDVTAALNKQAKTPVYVTVTDDEDGNVGWTEIEQWDFNAAT